MQPPAPHLSLLALTAAALLTVAACLSGGGCTPTGSAEPDDADSFEAVKDIHGGPFSDMMLVYLKTGPTSATQTKEEASERFKGHMENMGRLAEARVLLIAGPFDKPRDKNWRGIFLLDRSNVQLSQHLVQSDPAVKAGVFITECRPIKASIALRSTLDLENAMKEAAAKEAEGKEAPAPDPTKPPPNLRKYVMITADDTETLKGALAKSGYADKIVWCAKFSNRGDKGAVVVVDADKVEDVQAALDKAGAGASAGLGLDGWWSTTSLQGLEPAARKLP
jgi:uncharacterized protein YciI